MTRRGGGDERERALLRLAVPAAKYWVTKRCAPVVVEAAECLGGNGYVEESGLPRLVRESPLNSVWEGAGNVQALDVLRALGREPAALDAYLTEVGAARGADHRLDAAIRDLLTDLADLAAAEGRARLLTERLALVLQGSLLVRYAPPEVADAFCASRLGSDGGAALAAAAVDAGSRGGGGAGPPGGLIPAAWRRGWCCADTAPPPAARACSGRVRRSGRRAFEFGHPQSGPPGSRGLQLAVGCVRTVPAGGGQPVSQPNVGVRKDEVPWRSRPWT
ncbi:hypothetical protein SVIOM342S_02046 [Streptomyces violaceorubidus]